MYSKPDEEGVSHIEQHHVLGHEVLLHEVQHLLHCGIYQIKSVVLENAFFEPSPTLLLNYRLKH